MREMPLKYRLLKPADTWPKALHKLKKAMDRISDRIEKSGQRELLLKDLLCRSRD